MKTTEIQLRLKRRLEPAIKLAENDNFATFQGSFTEWKTDQESKRADKHAAEVERILAMDIAPDKLVSELAAARLEIAELDLARQFHARTALALEQTLGDVIRGRSLSGRLGRIAQKSVPRLNGLSSEELKASLLEAWLSGRYASRDECAEQCGPGHGYEVSYARDLLTGTQDPPRPWRRTRKSRRL